MAEDDDYTLSTKSTVAETVDFVAGFQGFGEFGNNLNS